MIENYLRQRTTVERRIMGISLIVLLFFLLSVPLIFQNNTVLSSRLQEISNVEARTVRLLLKASASASASRANLIHYLHGFFSDVTAPIEDADETLEFLRK
jgi:hypothetical protein